MSKFLPRIFVFVLIFLNGTVYSQSVFFQWAKQIGGGQADQGFCVEVDKNNNLYIAGVFNGTVDFDPGSAVYNLTGSGAYVVKLDKFGNFVWANNFNGLTTTNSSPYKISMCIDSIGCVFLAGCTNGSIVDLNPGPATYTVSGSVAYVKLNSNGNFVWGGAITGSSSSAQALNINDIAVNKNGNLTLVGGFEGTTDFNPGTGVSSLVSAGNKDIFILNLTSAGVFNWAKKMGGTDEDKAYSIENDKNGNIYTTGSFKGSADFDPGTANGFLYTSVTFGDVDVFISKLDASGNYVWAKSIGNTNTDFGNSIKVDNNSNILIGGLFLGGTVDFDPGGGTSNMASAAGLGFILKLNSAGTFLWAKQTMSLNGINIDRNNNVYGVGNVSGTYDFDNSPGVTSVTSSGGNDAFVLKLNSLGDFQWVSVFGGSSSDDRANATVIDSIGNVFTTGIFDGISDFNPGSGIYSMSTEGSFDGFILKLTNCIYDAPDICLVTVDSLALNNVIYWDKSMYPEADSFIVYRYDAFAMIYKRIGAKSINQPNYLIDTARTVGGPNGGDPQYSSSRYKLAIRGVCGAIGTQGLYHESIFIQQNNQNFSWNAYGIEGQTSPATGYQFMRDNVNNGTWQVLVNTGGLSTTDPNYLSYPNGNWRVDALGFSCNPTAKLSPNAIVNKSKSNVKNNFIVTSANELELNANVLLSPNPAKTELTVTFSNHQQIKTEFVITDVLGKIISKTETLESNKIILPLNDMSAGVYFLKIKQGKFQVTKKFVKE